MNRIINNEKALLAFILLLWCVLTYANSLDVPFYFDDVVNIEEHSAIHLQRLTVEGVLGAGVQGFLATRPVANISFALNHYLHQDSVAGYHAVNIAIHALNGLFAFLLFLATFRLAPGRSKRAKPELIAFIAALLWLAHPIQTQSVTYIVQRMNSMAALFYIISLYFYVQGRLAAGTKRAWPWFGGSILSGFLALGSKEIAITLPFFILLYEWYFFQDLSRDWLKKRIPEFIGLIAFVAAIIFLYVGTDPVSLVSASYAHRDFTLAQRVLTEFRVVFFYLSLLIMPIPSRLSLEHDFVLSQTFFSPLSTAFAFGGLVLIFALAVYLARKERLISFCILWFFGNLVVESSVIGLEIIFEHRLYLPSMFFLMLIPLLTVRIVSSQRFLWPGYIVIIFLLSFWTMERNNVWRDPVRFWQGSIVKAATNPRPYSNLGLAFYRKGMVAEAIAKYRKALMLKPDFASAHNNLGVALQDLGRLDEAAHHFTVVLKTDPMNAKVYNNLGNISARQGDLLKAHEHLREALRLDPQYAKAHNNLGNVLQLQGRYREAINHYQQALSSRPDYEDARFNMGIAAKRAAQGGSARE